MTGAEIEAEGGAQGGQPGQGFAFRHAGATAGPTEHDRLHQARDGQFAAQSGRRGLVGADARHHLHWDLGIGQPTDLLGQGAVEAGIAVVEPHHPLAGAGPLHHGGDHLFQGERAGANPFASGGGQGGDLGIHQRIGPNQHLRLLDRPSGAQGEQIGGAGTSPHNPNGLAGHQASLALGSGRGRRLP